MPYWGQDGNRIYMGDALEVLKGLPDESVHCCVTSPPYWGLRDYGIEGQIWDGDSDCVHEWETEERPGMSGGTNCKAIGGWAGGSVSTKTTFNKVSSQFCRLCGAWKGSLGLEPTPELFIQHMVEIFREVRRVLRSDGVLFLNLGDTYWGGKGQSGSGGKEYQQLRSENGISFSSPEAHVGGKGKTKPQDSSHDIYKPKDLCGIPWRVALALQADGWWLRSDIIWSKNNPMPESVTDRPTKSHEYIFLLTKSAKYFYDAEAVRELYTEPLNRWGGPTLKEEKEKHSKYLEMQNISESSALRAGMNMRPNPSGRNKRTVWTIPTQPFSGAHFAVFPEKLIEPCILAGTSEKGCCAECGKPIERVVERTAKNHISRYDRQAATGGAISGGVGKNFPDVELKTIGWQPTCQCNVGTIPCIVLDPFFGSGTTGIVAHKHGRKFIGIELSQKYLDEIAIPRIEKATKQLKLF